MRTTDQILTSLSHDGGGRSLPERLCHDCADVLGLTGVAMSLANDDGLQAVLGASGSLVRRLEELQLEVGEGPAVETSRDGWGVLHADLAEGAVTRWPVFAPTALDLGVRFVHTLPLQVGAVRLGALGLYGATPGRPAGDGAATALSYAAAAVAVLLDLQAQTIPGEPGAGLHPQLDEPVSYRAAVHQATGYVSVQSAVTLRDALLLLRARAYAGDRPLLDVARDVLAGRLQIRVWGSEDD